MTFSSIKFRQYSCEGSFSLIVGLEAAFRNFCKPTGANRPNLKGLIETIFLNLDSNVRKKP